MDKKILAPNGMPVKDTFPANTFFEYNVTLGFTQGGSYKVFTTPKDVWISVFDETEAEKLFYGKGECSVRLGPGTYTVKIRHSNKSDTEISTTFLPIPRQV